MDWTADQQVIEVPQVRPHDAAKLDLLWRGPVEHWRRNPVKPLPDDALQALDDQTEAELLRMYNREKLERRTGEDVWATWSRAAETLLRRRAVIAAQHKGDASFSVDDPRYVGRGSLQEVKIITEQPSVDDNAVLKAWTLAEELARGNHSETRRILITEHLDIQFLELKFPASITLASDPQAVSTALRK